MATIQREDYILHEGDTISCPGGVVYTISGAPIGFGGSAIVYPAVRNDTALEYALKECFPGRKFVRREGVVSPSDPDDPAAVGLLAKYRDNLEEEQRIGQIIRNHTTQAVSIYETLTVESITASGQTFPHAGNAIFSVLERMDQKARSFDSILREIRSSYSREKLRTTMGLPPIYITACMMEQILRVLQVVHQQNFYYGDLHNANVCFTNTCLQENRAGIAHLLDFGSSRPLDSTGHTEELLGEEVFSTKGFRPPEMLKQGFFRLSKQADIYSAGCLMLCCVATPAKRKPLGESPVIRPNFLDDLDGERIGCTGKELDLVNEILEKALAEKCSDRYPDVQQMLDHICQLKDNTEPPRLKLSPNLSPADYFIPGSRNRELCSMAQVLKRGEPVFIWGIGGIGKTETAIALARKVSPPQGSYLIHYRNCMRETILSLDFEGYLPPTKKHGTEIDEQADYTARMNILKKQYGSALFVIDNFDAPGKTLDDLRKEPAYQELINLGIQLVFTTRCPIPWQPEHRLQPLAAADQLKLMRQFCPSSTVTDQQLHSLIEEVGGHTLTISLIAKTMHASEGRITPDDILRALRESRLSRQAMPPVVTDQNRTYEEAALYAHLKALFDLSTLDDQARAVMECCAFLGGTGMDKVFFFRGLDARQQAACTGLVQHGWLSLSDAYVLQIHPLIREIVRETIQPDSGGYPGFLARMADWVEQEQYGTCILDAGIAKWSPAQTTLQQTAQLADWASEAADFLADPTESLLWLAALCSVAIKRPVKARYYADRAMARTTDALPPRELARHYHAAARYHYEIDWPRCLSDCQRACAQWEQVLSAPMEEAERNQMLHAYAQACELACLVCYTDFHNAITRRQCRYEAALEYGRQALALAEQCSPRDDFLISRVHLMLAGTCRRMEFLGSDCMDGLLVGWKAHRQLRGMGDQLRSSQIRHLDAARTAAARMADPKPCWTALLHETMGDTLDADAAAEHYRTALQLRLDMPSSGEESQAGNYDNIANLYMKLGDSKTALSYKMQKTDLDSGKWYVRFLEWFRLFFTRSTQQLTFCGSVLDAIRMILLVALFIPLGVVFIVAMLFVLRDSAKEADGYLSQKRKDEAFYGSKRRGK